jgi:hypothetical protein
MATRTAISLDRTAARASRRFATFAQAMRRTKATQRLDVDAPSEVRLRILRLERRGDPIEVQTRLLDRDAGLEPAHHLPRVVAAILERIGLHRRPCAGVGWKLEAARHHADNGVRDAVDHDRLADRTRSPFEPLPPDTIAQNDDLGRADAILVLAKIATERRRDAEHVERGPRYDAALHVVGAVARREVVRGATVEGDALETAVLGLPTAEVRVGHGVHVPPALRVGLPDRHELVRRAVREGAEQQRTNAAEYGRVDTDAERETKDGRDGERRALGECSEGVAKVREHDSAGK